VEHELGMAERLEAGAEPRLRLADALGDRADTPPLERVEVKDAVGLSEADLAEDDRFRLPGVHEASVDTGPVESSAVLGTV
jgi:hypothetical protein